MIRLTYDDQYKNRFAKIEYEFDKKIDLRSSSTNLFLSISFFKDAGWKNSKKRVIKTIVERAYETRTCLTFCNFASAMVTNVPYSPKTT